MTKGISPLIASVLLIAITIAIAAILASWVTSYTEEALPTTTCVGGSMSFVSNEYPKINDAGALVACVEAKYVALGNFKFEVLFDDDTVETYDDASEVSIVAGGTGCPKTEDD